MEVKDFSEKIYDAAKKNTGGRTFNNLTRYLVGAGVIATEVFALRNFKDSLLLNPFYHGSGAIAFATGSIADDHISDKTFELFNDPRFKEYGFERLWREENGTLPSHPTKKEASSRKQKTLKIIGGIVSTVIPPFGHTMLAMSALAYENNYTANKRIEMGFEIGDEVDKMIKIGKSEDDIKIYLESLIKKNVK
jgi:hypothetical protein